jgi:Mg-chelatase subunit ChlD
MLKIAENAPEQSVAKHRKPGTLERALPLVAKTLGDKLGVKVRIGGAQAYTNGKTIVIPVLPPDNDEASALAWGYIAHESAHVKFTDFGLDHGLNPVGFGILNAIEDARIEIALENVYPGVKRWLDDLYRNLAPKIEVDENNHPARIFSVYVITRVMDKYLNRPMGNLPERATRALDAAFPKPIVVRLKALLSEVPNLGSTQEALALTKRILKMLQDEQKKEEQRQKQQQNQDPESGDDSSDAAESGDQGDSEEQSSGGDSSDADDDADDQDESGSGGSDAGEDEDEDDSDDQGESGSGGSDAGEDEDDSEDQDESGSGGSDAGEDEDDSDDQGESGSGGSDAGEDEDDSDDGDDTDSGNSSGDDSSDAGNDGDDSDADDQSGGNGASRHRVVEETLDASEEDVEQGFHERAKEELENGAEEDAVYTSIPTIDQLNDGSANEKGVSGRMMEVRATSNRLRSRLQGLVQARKPKPFTASRGRKVQTRKLARMATGNTRVFQKQFEATQNDTAIHLLVDNSGSMGGSMAIANSAALALSLALEPIKDVKTAVSYFPGRNGTNVLNVLDFGDKVQPKSARFDRVHTGGTPMAEALMHAAKSLAPRRETRKIVIALTDGGPDCGSSTQYAVKMLRRAGVEVIGIGIGCDLVQHYFPKWGVIHSVDELQQALFDLAENILLD